MPPPSVPIVSDERRVIYEHTARGLERERPEDYALIIEALGQGIPVHAIASSFKVGVGTIYAIRRENFPQIGKLKEHLATIAREVAQTAIEVAAEAFDDPDRRKKMTPKDCALTAAILLDKAKDLEETRTPIKFVLEIRRPTHDDYMDAITIITEDKDTDEEEKRSITGGGGNGPPENGHEIQPV